MQVYSLRLHLDITEITASSVEEILDDTGHLGSMERDQLLELGLSLEL